MALKWLEMSFFKFQWLEILTGTELWRMPPWKEIQEDEDDDDEDDEDDEAGSRTRLKEVSGTRLVYKHRFRRTWSLGKDRCDRSCLLKHRMTRKALVPRLLLFCKQLVYPLWQRPVLWFFRPWCWSCSDHWLKKQSNQWFLFLVAICAGPSGWMRWWGRVWRGPRWRRTNFHGLNMAERGGISQTGNFNLEGHGKPVETFFFLFFRFSIICRQTHLDRAYLVLSDLCRKKLNPIQWLRRSYGYTMGI